MSKHNHYFKDVSQLSVIDVYRTLILFAVTDPCIQHAVKKLLVAGGRGAGKDISQDIQEAIDSLERWKQMRVEETPIYNRRSEDNISLVGFPEVKYEDTYQDEPSDSPYKTTSKFKAGDIVLINSHEAGKEVLGEEKGVGTHGKVLSANDICVDVEIIHDGKVDLAFYYPKELTIVR